MMRRRRWALCCSLLLAAACSGNSDASSAAPGASSPPDASDVLYVGATTDEALLRLLDATPKDVPQQHVVIDAPDLGSPLSKDSPATIDFHLASATTRAPSPSPRLKPAPRRPAWQRPWHDFLQLVGPPRIAHAHGAAYNGTGYFLVFVDAASKPQLRVFTDTASYAPDAIAWQRLAEASQPLNLQVTSAYFEENSIPADGGPFIGGSFEFRIR